MFTTIIQNTSFSCATVSVSRKELNYLIGFLSRSTCSENVYLSDPPQTSYQTRNRELKIHELINLAAESGPFPSDDDIGLTSKERLLDISKNTPRPTDGLC